MSNDFISSDNAKLFYAKSSSKVILTYEEFENILNEVRKECGKPSKDKKHDRQYFCDTCKAYVYWCEHSQIKPSQDAKEVCEHCHGAGCAENSRDQEVDCIHCDGTGKPLKEVCEHEWSKSAHPSGYKFCIKCGAYGFKGDLSEPIGTIPPHIVEQWKKLAAEAQMSAERYFDLLAQKHPIDSPKQTGLVAIRKIVRSVTVDILSDKSADYIAERIFNELKND